MTTTRKLSLTVFRIVSGLVLAAPLSLQSQIALNGIVVKKPFTGGQPDLISGVSSLPAVERPLLRHVYLASPEVLGLIIDEKALIPSRLKPYHPLPGDTIRMAGYHGLNKVLVRCGEPVGFLAGRNNEWYRPFNESAGEPLDLDWITNPDTIRVSSPDDPNYRVGVTPSGIFRKTLPRERISRLNLSPDHQLGYRHFLYLKLPSSLKPGKHYQIDFADAGNKFQPEARFYFDDRELRSEAIHVNLYGYQPADRKIAFLSSWMGDGGSAQYPEGLSFSVVRLADGQPVFEGSLKLRQRADLPEYSVDERDDNLNKADVWEMDFSPLRELGSYKVVIDGIGCSFDFLVDDDIWENTARLLMKGFLHQRAGIELGPPYTDYLRPRNMHPADGQIIHKVDPEIFFSFKGRFEQIKGSLLERTSIPEAWGGWMDAGDFDRRMTHFFSVRRMMYLCEMKPEYFEGLKFNIPESNNDIPDILDEALWCLDLFRRTQGVYQEGAVSWQVESIEHPRYGETSWLNSLPTALIPPSPQSCIEYVGTAAHMALLLRKYDQELAGEYEKSALEAMDWFLANPDAPEYGRTRAESLISRDGSRPGSRQPQRYHLDLAYLNLYRLTKDPKWHHRFRECLASTYPEGLVGNLTFTDAESVVAYALMAPGEVDVETQLMCQEAIIDLADELLEGAATVTYGIPRLRNEVLTRLVPMKHKILPLVAAHFLSHNDKYADVLSRSIQYTMGANPLNRSYISGLGERSFTPYQHDWHADSLPIPSGIPNFGPTSTNTRDLIAQQLDAEIVASINEKYGIYPLGFEDWPMAEACFDQTWIWPLNEFMVETPMGELLLLTAYLAAP